MTGLNRRHFLKNSAALDRMMSGQVSDLFLFRQYLDAESGGWA